MKTLSPGPTLSIRARAAFCAVSFTFVLLALTGCGTKGELQRPAAENAEVPAPAAVAPPTRDQPRP